MKKGKQLLRRALTVFMSLAIVFTSVNVPTMTVMAAQETGETVETPVAMEDVATETAAPAAPIGLVAQYWNTEDANYGKIYVAWNTTDLGEGGTPATYTIYVGDTEVATVDYSATPNNNTFIENSYEAGSTITIGITATNEIGTSGKTTTNLTLPAAEGEGQEETIAPAAPQGFVAQYWSTEDTNYGKIYVAWNNNLGDGGTPETYTIYVDDAAVATVDYPTTTTFLDNSYEAGTYVIGITATNNIGTSAKTTVNLELTDEQAGSGEDPATLAPAAPVGLVVEYYAGSGEEDEHADTVKVMWNNSNIGNAGTPEEYVVYVDDVAKTTVSANATPEAYLENTFEANKEYTIGLTAKNANGESEKATDTITLTEEQAGVAPVPTTSGDVVISEQISQAFVGNDVELTYVADSDTFTFSGHTIKVNGTDVTANATIDASAKTITLAGSLFASEGVYDITVTQDDCTFTPVYQRVYATGSEDEWNLVWQDEFNGTELDSSKWDHQIGRGTEYTDTGWGNQEEQYYTDSTENSFVEDGKLTIKAIKDETYGYTSARIRTTNVETGKKNSTYDDDWALYNNAYGKIEAKIKLPAGKGIWPAFWMLPENSKYGTWAASGEIDIMEAKGRLTDEIVGTIHYGGAWPNNTSTGEAYYFSENDKANFEEYHIYGIEWDPDEIRWYVDGELYSTLNNWYAEASEEGNFPYPAPFDEEFHLLLNMAVGGTFDSAVSSSEVEVGTDGVCMDVDYVRWYQRDGGYADWEIELPQTEKDDSDEAKTLLALADEDGNFIKDADFADMDTTPKTTNGSWDIARGNWIALLIPDNGNGSATWSKTTANDENVLKVQVANVGSQVYSSQMIQYFPVVKGYSYEISYKAYTDSADTKSDINLKIGGDDDNGWSAYSGNYTDALSTTPTTFTHKFTMSGATDPTARFEFNLATSAGTVYITDVAVKILENGISEDEGQDDAKEPLSDGNHIYNGEFNVGSDGLLYWHWGTNDEEGVVASVTEGSDFVANVTEATSLWQNGMNLLQSDTYKVTADVNSTAAQTVTVALTKADGTVYVSKDVELAAGSNSLEAELVMPEGTTDTAGVFKIAFASTATIDSIKMIRTTNNNLDWDSISYWPLYNGDFFNGTDGWNIWSQGGGGQSNTVGEDGKLAWTVNMPTAGNYWDIGAESRPMELTKGINYKVKFDYEVPAEAGTKTIGFKFTDRTDPTYVEISGSGTYTSDALLADGNCALAFYFGAHQTDAVTIKLDNIEVYVDPDSYSVPSGYAKPVSLKQLGYGRLNTPANVLYSEDTTWEAAAKTYFLNGEEIAADDVTIDTEGNKLSIAGTHFTAGGEYTFAVKAEGYTKTLEAKLIVLATSNLLLNGDFSEGTSSWNHYFADWLGSGSTFSVNEDGVAVITSNGGWEADWNIQLFQEGIEYEAGTYVLEFDAWADVDRSIGAQLQNGNDVVAGTANTFAISTESQHYKVIYTDLAANSGVKLDFPMGLVTHDGVQSPNTATTIYMDNVQFRPSTEDDFADVPGVIASAGASTVKEAVTIEYTQAYKAWREAAKTVYVNNKKVNAKYVKEVKAEDGTVTGLTLDGSLFKNAGAYTIYVVGKNGTFKFEPTNTIKKNVYGTDGNRIFNGTMDSDDYWTVYDEDAAGLSKGSIANGKYTLDYKAGYFKTDWNCWVTWSSQLKQDSISVENGKTYKLRFKANTDMTDGRDVIIETSFGQETVHIDTATNIYEIDIVANATKDDMYVSFLLGPVGSNLQTATPAEGVAHTLMIDTVELYESSVAPAMPGQQIDGLWIKNIADQIYTGSAIKPAIEVYEGNTKLTSKDYKVTYKNNKNVGTATVTVEGKGNYKGKDTTTFEIKQKNIADSDITITPVYAKINANGVVKKNPAVVIKYGKVTLKETTKPNKVKDYTLTWPPITVSGNAVPGEYEITVTGTGNYKGTTTIPYDVLVKETLLMKDAKISISQNSPVKKIDYANQEVKPIFKVKIGSRELTPAEYDVEYPDVLTVGKNNVVTFTSKIADVYGSKTFKVEVTGSKINAKDITAKLTVSNNTVSYTGNAFEYPTEYISVTKAIKTASGNTIEQPLTYGTDYDLVYKNNVNAGKATIQVVGINGYTGKKEINFTIKKADLSASANNVELVLASDTAAYSKKGAKVPVAVIFRGEELSTSNYKVTYSDNTALSTDTLAKITVTGKGKNFEKTSVYAYYKVVEASAADLAITAKDIKVPESVDQLKTTFTIKEAVSGKKLKDTVDYDSKGITYMIADETAENGYKSVSANDLEAGTEVTAFIPLLGNYDGEGTTPNATVTFVLYNTSISKVKIAPIAEQKYTGDHIRPSLDGKVTIKVNGENEPLIEGKDYIVTYDDNTNVAVGKSKITITGIGEYNGTKSVTFKISKKPMDFVGFMQNLKELFD